MGSIILPWNLVVLFLVTSLAAMPQSNDDMDVRTVTRLHSGSRHLGTDRKQHCTHVDSSEQVIQSPSLTYVDYEICIIRPSTHQKVEDGIISGLVEFESRQVWGGYKFLQNTNTYGAICTCSEKTAVHYDGEKVVKVHVMTQCTDCSWWLIHVIIKIPNLSECYVCGWGNQRQIEPGLPVQITCVLDINNNNKYC